MFRIILLWIVFGFCSQLQAQEITTPYKNRKIVVTTDTLRIDSVSINKAFFKLMYRDGRDVDTTAYNVDFQKSIITFTKDFRPADTLTLRYLMYPEYLTRRYSIYDDSRVVSREAGQTIYGANRDPVKKFVPFEGLNTSGSITRGITIGNNQNAVVNSNLDLQITGKISQNVTLKASIQDSNIPLQEGGYSQKLDEFDQIFIELAGAKWSVRAGDLFLENRQSRFLNFSKKVQGLSGNYTFGAEGKKTNIFASAALVRGQYARSSFVGQEGNQGPYKLRGPNGELYVLVISGSERVFVNGVLLTRGESNDYIIDYNAGEIIFTSLFPITSEMRINIEYQYSERNYTRFVTYAGAVHEQEKWSLGGYVYSENDVKNQPLQQNLSEEQVQILSDAGDDQTQMTAPSAFEDTYSENKILYEKVFIDGVEVFEYSNDPAAELYNVRFTLVGNLQGNYKLVNGAAIGRIYQYVAPLNGVPQGNYEPITRLTPPTKLQIATIIGKFIPSEKTSIDFEAGVSNNDVNLFSTQDDDNNVGLAGKLNLKQRLFSRKWKVDAFANYQFLQEDFRTVERLFAIEFERDWNIINPRGNQSLLISGVNAELTGTDSTFRGNARYQFEKLDFTENFSGSRNVTEAHFKSKSLTVDNSSSFLKSDGELMSSEFLRSYSFAKFSYKRNWIGSTFRYEDNQQRLKATNELSVLTQRFSEVGAFIGRGDSTRVFVELGYVNRSNDSIQNGYLQRVNTSDTYYIKSKLIQTEKSSLSVFVNYRNLKYTEALREDENSLNSRVLYNDRFFNQLIQVTSAYETTSGQLPQQEFTYLEVDPGQGVYTWNDYNSNDVQELEEFEVAPFPDLAKYVRVFLPNQIFIKTHQNKFSQSVTLNPAQWQNETGFKKFLSYFYNQTSYSIDRKIARTSSNFKLNPFSTSDDDLLGLNSGFRNSLFYNRGKQRHSVTYNYLNNRARNLLSVGSQESTNYAHQLQYTHLLKKHWLVNLAANLSETTAESENFAAKNFEIDSYQASPKLSYLFSKNAAWDIFYEYQYKLNAIGDQETLNQMRVGTSFTYSGEKKITMNGEFSLYKNKFTGDQMSPVAFQMLEGLQPGENLTWRLLLQKNLTEYLDINLNYQGRKSETSKAIHTGSIQLRAFF
ncbi:MAG TPA: hypothetical protein VGB44_01280 [Flavobacterium sp.]